jgi:hypothetical protein
MSPIPYLNNDEILKELARCFTSENNPAGSSTSNMQFQCDSTEKTMCDDGRTNAHVGLI